MQAKITDFLPAVGRDKVSAIDRANTLPLTIVHFMHVTFLITTQPLPQPATFEKRSRKFLIFVGYNSEINFQTDALWTPTGSRIFDLLAHDKMQVT